MIKMQFKYDVNFNTILCTISFDIDRNIFLVSSTITCLKGYISQQLTLILNIQGCCLLYQLAITRNP